jgi:hypothetical protein
MTPDYDDPAIEAQWCAEQRAEVIDFLMQQRIDHGRVGEWPAWHVAPYVAVWAIEHASRPDALGGWVLSGDLPMDYVGAGAIGHPRDAVQAIAQRWLGSAAQMARGAPCRAYGAGTPAQARALAPMLRSRAETLIRWVGDATLWEDDGAVQS